ncbi:calcium-activated chloride channel regulator 1-like [Penaeus chinensis]|uniref:calcium-activated chloride channel regulator 1-like n=1 Tax=Penaeus chinensis TaxID=139456 RepID=UPI001FB6E822|nr:calcium-activated chloride channel regulator 1-like [Penaeus chinensis]XP_047488363.1 calcium-activated chloride channel regulator 1-like [Penaeus chinensis]
MRRRALSSPSAPSLSVLLVACLLPAGIVASSRVELINNGYENLVIGISPSLPESEGAALIPAIKEMIKDASEVLFTATRRRAFFRDVRIVIPKSWTNTDTDEVAVFESFEESDLRIDNPNTVYENQPYTRQPGECRDPGDFIHMTPAYLKEEVFSYYYGPPAKVLVMEWARLRWGVYDEIGYSGDPKYPIFFSLPREDANGRTDVQNQVEYQVNVCTNTNLKGKERMWFDETMLCTYTHEGLPDDDCVFFPDTNQTAKSSLMSFPLVFSDTLVEFCDEHTHNSLAKTKHNDRCDGQSVWEVMLQHSDFKANANPAISNPEEPMIKVVRKTNADHVLVLDYSGSMSTADRMGQLQLAAQRWLLHELQLYSSVAIVRFDSTASLLAPLTKIDGDAVRKSLATQIHTNNNGGTSIGAGLKMAVELLEGRANKNIFLITDGEENESPMIADVMDEIISKKICVSTLALGSNAAKDLEKLGDLTKCPTFTVNDHDESNALANAFESVSSRQQSVSLGESFIKIEETPKIQTADPTYEDSFLVDSTVGRNLTFRLKADDKSHVISGPTLTRPNGTSLQGAADFDDIGNVWTIVVPEAEEGFWQWKVTLSQDSSKYIQATVLALPRHPDDAPIVTTVKFLAPATGVSPKEQNIKIIATVMKGNSPIRGAHVVAYVTPPDTTASVQEYDLLDNGVGADAVSGDGIYSRYMTKFAGGGRYSIKALVKGGSGASVNNGPPPPPTFPSAGRRRRRSADLSINPKPCCGSIVPYDPDTATPTGNFTRVSSGSSLKVSDPPAPDEDILPPCKVTDLQVAELYGQDEGGNVLTLFWTSPGDDHDEGTASDYTFRLSEVRPDLTNKGFGEAPASTLLHFERAALNGSGVLAPFGSSVAFNVTYRGDLIFGTEYLVALKAKDEAGNESLVSNVASFFLDQKLVLPTWADELIKKLKKSNAEFFSQT